MRSPGYFPTTDPERILWVGNFSHKFAIHGPNLNFSAEVIAEIVADLNFYLWFLQVWTPALQNLNKEAATYRVALAKGGVEASFPCLPVFSDSPAPRPAGVLERLFNLVSLIKLAPGYNDQVIGQELRILRAPAANGIRRENPAYAMSLVQGPERKHVQIAFKKHGHDGVAIESRRAEGEWEFLAADNASPHLDERPLLVPKTPEVREYRLRWWDKGVPNGEWSPIQSILVTP